MSASTAEQAGGEGPILEARGLSFRYGARTALADFSFSVRRGEAFGLVGPNGGGKSTAFRLLSTLVLPPWGTLFAFGRDVREDPERYRRRLGVVFQSPALDPLLTVSENLEHQGRLYGIPRAERERRAAKLLSVLGVSDRAADRVGTLSGGLRRRVELAKALLPDPAILLLDEPTAGLDPAARAAFWEALERLLRERALAVVASTHYLEEAERFDRLVLLAEGRTAAQGTPSELKAALGGKVLRLRTRDPEGTRRELSVRFGLAAAVAGGWVHTGTPDAAKIAAELLRDPPPSVEAVQVGEPTLEDVFRKAVGREWSDGDGE